MVHQGTRGKRNAITCDSLPAERPGLGDDPPRLFGRATIRRIRGGQPRLSPRFDESWVCDEPTRLAPKRGAAFRLQILPLDLDAVKLQNLYSGISLTGLSQLATVKIGHCSKTWALAKKWRRPNGFHKLARRASEGEKT